jgi:hypothetical protein
MKQVKVGLYAIGIPVLIQICRFILSKLTGNVNFITPNPSLASVKSAVDALEQSYENASHGGTLLTQDMYAKQQTLLDLMKLLGAYVQNASGGDATKINSSGFSMRSTNRLPADLAAPINLKAIVSAMPNNINLKWKRVKGNKMYVVQMTSVADAQSGWGTIGMVTKTKFTATGLTAGHKYWFRVAAQNSVGQSAYSDVAQLMALG